jgi:hypothetical protein
MKKEYDFSIRIRSKFYLSDAQINIRIEGFRIIERIVVSKSKPIMQTILYDDGKRPSASEYIYHSREFTERQENFYQNLLRIYLLTGSKNIHVYFSDNDGRKLRLDRGCVAMAVHDGFLKPLEDDQFEILSQVVLNW